MLCLYIAVTSRKRVRRKSIQHGPVTLDLPRGVGFRGGSSSGELYVAVGLEGDQSIGAAQLARDRRHAEERQIGGDALVTRRAQHPRGHLQGWTLRGR